MGFREVRSGAGSGWVWEFFGECFFFLWRRNLLSCDGIVFMKVLFSWDGMLYVRVG